MINAVQNSLESLALRALAAPVRALPRRRALELGAAIGQLAWWSGVRRALVLSNLEQAAPASTPRERLDLGRRAALNLGRTIAEYLRFSGADRRHVLDVVSLEGADRVRTELSAGRGVVIVTGHIGAWALYVTALAAAGLPSSLLVGRQRNPYVDRLILGIPGDAVQFISKGSRAPRQVLESLRAGRAVVMVADHYISSEAVWAPFLGRSASTLPLPGALVAKHGLPLFLMCGTRDAGDRHHVRLRRLEVPAGLTGDALRLEVAVLCNRELGREVLACPEQYWWYHDRWKVRGVYRKRKRLLGTPPEPNDRP
jgi:KDO2-lipid IV(A) lauroyltransferase